MSRSAAAAPREGRGNASPRPSRATPRLLPNSVFNHRNASLAAFLLGDYFFPTPFPASVSGYVSSYTTAQSPTYPATLTLHGAPSRR